MPEPSFHTTRLRELLDRLRAGDPAARDDLLRAARSRLEVFADRMLRRFPGVGRWADADDVFQGAAVRLLRAVEAVPVANTRELLNLAATQVRRELIDLARHFGGPCGVGANHDSAAAPDPGDPADDPADLDRWAAFHSAADGLPVELREVFGLRFYHDWTNDRIAELLDVDEKTVRRRWLRAVDALKAAVGGDFPAD
jgi:RNA polymerase sigma factor (sigma-70 family)